jgi:hypothetical protein
MEMSQEKISAAQAAQVYSEVPGVLRGLVTERDELKTKLASADAELAEYKQRERIEKIARSMDDKNIDIGSSLEEKVDRIKEAHVKGRSLDAIEEAVELTAPNGGLGKLGSAEEVGNGANQLEAYLLGGLSD